VMALPVPETCCFVECEVCMCALLVLRMQTAT
jgi:hypothetical protein